MAHYGWYFIDTSGLGGTDGFAFDFEGGETYSVYGLPEPMIPYAESQGIDPSGPNGSFRRFSMGSGIAGFAAHLHVLDPCVAQGTC